MRAHRRGSALITVLLVSTLLVVVCFSLASTAMLNLNFADKYAIRTQSLLVAQAAVTQLAAELDEAQEGLSGGAVDTPREARLDLLARYRDKPVFPAGGDRFPGEVSITFDATKPYFSVDNQYNDTSAVGWFDKGGSERSVPPFTLSVIVTVKMGGHMQRFEALLRRRWPYVLTTPGRVVLFGTPTWHRDHATTASGASHIAGRVYHLPNISFTMPRPPDQPPPPDDGSSVFVDGSLIEGLLNVYPKEQGVVTVGGEAEYRPPSLPFEPPPVPVTITSEGNELIGNVDVAAETSDSLVYTHAPNNYWLGQQREGVKPPNIVRNLQRAFQLPPMIGEWTRLDPPHPELYAPPADAPSDPAPSGAPGTDPGTDPGGDPGTDPGAEPGTDPGTDPGTGPGTDPPPPPPPPPDPSGTGSPSGSPSGAPEPTPEPSPFYVIYDADLKLNGPEPPPGEAFDYPPEARYRIDMSAGNRYVKNTDDVMTTGYGLEMHNCVLHIAGDLDLSSPSGSTQVPALRGFNATLIVDGTLILTNGSLEASQAGMVIYCRRLVTAAKGDYRGLIMVQKSAAICPAVGGENLKIQGGVVCGGEGIHLYSRGTRPSEGDTGVTLGGLHLWSANLSYDPKYLRTLHRFGPLELLSLRWFE